MNQGICTTLNNRFKWSRIFDSKTNIKFHSRTGNTWFAPGIEVWSADRKFWIFFDSHGYKRKLILIRNMGFGHVPTPAIHVLLVHMNMLQGLKIHQGLKIKHIFTHQHSKYFLSKLLHDSSDGWATGWHYKGPWLEHPNETKMCFFWKVTRFENCINFQNARAIIFQKQTIRIWRSAYFRVQPQDSIAGLLDFDQIKLLTRPLM